MHYPVHRRGTPLHEENENGIKIFFIWVSHRLQSYHSFVVMVVSDNDEPSDTQAPKPGFVSPAGDLPMLSVTANNGGTTNNGGVIYLSRVPPGIEMTALRALLSRMGRVGRMWLRPFGGTGTSDNNSPAGAQQWLRKRRRQTAFKDGWVEFLRREDALQAVTFLNGQPMRGAKKRGKFADDLWAIKFLPAFTWDDLSREVFGSRRERVLKVREQVAAARRERAWVEGRFDLSKRLQKGIKRSRELSSDEGEESKNAVPVPGSKVLRRFRQKKPIAEDDDERKARKSAVAVTREIETGVGRPIDKELLGKLFKKQKVGSS